jgi:hypothetical protein
MAVEKTDLKRRVLAHEQILQALLAQIAESRRGFLDGMRDRLARAGDTPAAPESRAISKAASMSLNARGASVVVRSAHAHGVWHVTCNDVFLGDYLSEDAAQSAAFKAATELRQEGRSTEVVFGAR